MLALLPLLLWAPAQSSDVVQVLLRMGEPVPGLALNSEIREFYNPHAGRGGGWIAQVRAYDPTIGSSNYWVLVGQRPGQIAGPVELLRQPMALPGGSQSGLFYPSMANGVVAYIASQTSIQRAWVEDQPIASSGDPVVGMAGWAWNYFEQIEVTTSGDVLLCGVARDIGGSSSRDVIWRWPQSQVLLSAGQVLPGFGTVLRFESYLSVSPNGQHWSQVVRLGPGIDIAIVVDGQILEATPGRPVVVGAALPPDVAGSYGPSIWDLFQYPAQLNDRGDWAIKGQIRTLAGNQENVIARNGRVFLDGNPFASMVGIDARGAIFNGAVPGLLIEEQPVVTWSAEVDIDGDGIADPGYGLCSLSWYDAALPGVDGLTLFSSILRLNSQCTFDDVLVRARPMRVDVPVCEGVPNSTGRPGQLVIGGSSQVVNNEVSLQIFGLPKNTPCYALLSRSAGFVTNPGGSQGNLCLGGGIGRMVLSLFMTGLEGRGQVALDLTALREPNGYVAAVPGDRWYFQAWYRDAVSGLATSNFTSASAVVFD